MTRKLLLTVLSVIFAAACSAADGGSDAGVTPDNTRGETGDIDGTGGSDVVDAGPVGDNVDEGDGGQDGNVGGDAVIDDAGDTTLTDTPFDPDVPLQEIPVGGDGGLVEVEEDTGTPPVPEGYWKSAELGLKILGPSATGVAQALGGSLQIAGMVVGKPDAIIWESQSGQSGYAEGAPFFLSGKVDLVQGDNVIKVTASQGDEEASDTITVTYNPAFRFGDVLRVRPSAIFTSTNTQLVFTLDMGLYSNFEASTLKLCECTLVGECVSDIHTMMDDGQVNVSGDEVGQDSVFSWKKKYTLDDPGKVCFRAHAVVKAGYQQYTAYSPVTCVDVVDHISVESCEAVQGLQQQANQLYFDTLATSDPGVARQAVIALLEADESVAEVGSSYQGYGVWVRYVSGMLGAFNFSPPGLRGGEEEGETEDLYGQIDAAAGGQELLIASKRSLVLGPYHAEFGAEDEATFVHNILDKSECPAFVLSQPKYDNKADLSMFREMNEYGVIAITTHGDSYFKQMSQDAKDSYDWGHQASQEVLWTGETVDCSELVQTTPTCSGAGGCPLGSDCIITQSSGQGSSISGVCIDFKQVDLATGRVVMGADRYGILPSFIGRYRGRGYPSSVVYLGSCRSLWNGTLGMELFGAGAKAVIGYGGYVTSTFAYEQGTDFWSSLIEELKWTGDSMPDPAPQDPQNPGTTLRLLGAPNLNATNADLINPSWETGDLTGWQATGDGRVISRLGITVPVEGKFMGIISTGMGYTPQTGEIFQTFCVPEDKMEMNFYWKYYSEEFKEWCGSTFQDTFEATLEGEDGMVTFVNASVDDLCPPQECVGCGGQYDGLIQADVAFDQGDAWMTHWRKAAGNVMALAGAGAVTLRFFATDKGDSIYDTAILIDTVKFK